MAVSISAQATGVSAPRPRACTVLSPWEKAPARSRKSPSPMVSSRPGAARAGAALPFTLSSSPPPARPHLSCPPSLAFQRMSTPAVSFNPCIRAASPASPSSAWASAGAAIVEAEFVEEVAERKEGSENGEQQGEGVVEERPKGGRTEAEFVWEQQWYPVGIVEEYDKKIPEAVTILGLPMVVWWDRVAGSWRVFQDLCPHRLAPLSEGRIHESGALQCSYHGWTFSGQGACTWIPQAPPDGPPVSQSPRACARVYPSREHQGILWVWPQHGAQAATLADATPIPTVPAQSDPAFHVNMGQCDLNYGYEMLVENLADPAHVPFAHHKIMANRNNASPMDFSVEDISIHGITGGGQSYRTFSFHPPCLINSLFDMAPKKQEGDASSMTAEEKAASKLMGGSEGKARQLSMAFYCVPRAPGKSRVILAFAFNFLPPVARSIPRWFSHINQMLILDSDHYFLHLAECRLREQGGAPAALSSYYTPTRSDAYVLAFRKWLQKFAGSEVQWPAGVDMRLPTFNSKQELMDRQQNHVKICKTCRGAQAGFERLQLVLQAVCFGALALSAVAAAAGAAAMQPGRVPPKVALVGVALSMLAGVAAMWLGSFIKKTYFFHDYIHALVD